MTPGRLFERVARSRNQFKRAAAAAAASVCATTQRNSLSQWAIARLT